jgi:mRNA interferase RelE/StbE
LLCIREKIRSFAEDPASQANNVKALQGVEGVIRLRVGDWRVIMRDGVVVEILEIKARGSAYRESRK